MSFDVIAILIILAVSLFAETALIVDAVRRAVAKARPVSHPSYHLVFPANTSRFRERGREIAIKEQTGRTAF
jgi:hypothetical protein